MSLQKELCCAIAFIAYVCSSCSALRCGSSQFKFSGFQAGLSANASLPANSTAVLQRYLSLLDGIFAQEITVAVLSGEVKLKHSGVYFLSATVHFAAAQSDACDGSGTIKVAICADNDCKNKASLQAVSQTCDKAFSLTATGLLLLTSNQILRVHLSNTGDSPPLTIGAASKFSGYLLTCTDS